MYGHDNHRRLYLFLEDDGVCAAMTTTLPFPEEKVIYDHDNHQPFPLSDGEGVCLDMVTTPFLSRKKEGSIWYGRLPSLATLIL